MKGIKVHNRRRCHNSSIQYLHIKVNKFHNKLEPREFRDLKININSTLSIQMECEGWLLRTRALQIQEAR